jgi:SAM-dependent methyltransferase
MIVFNGAVSDGALIRAEHPWAEAAFAELFDAFHYDADLPLYLELAAEQGGDVLELCCGTGRLLLPLADAGHCVTGLDASAAMLARARRKLANARPDLAERVRLVSGDIRAFDLGERFDLALVSTNSFGYLISRADQLRALRCIAAHLRPGGLLALALFHPSPAWLAQAEGSLRQDIAQDDPERGRAILRTETVVSNDPAAQVRLIRSAYEVVGRDGSVTKRLVEWPLRYTFRFEAEHLLERAGFETEALYGGYGREPFDAESPLMLFLGRRP